ncbi:hypothetical protein FB45DRAFT_938692, partial [Roridomyces roridus]
MAAAPHLDSTLGAFQISGALNTFLFGIETLQVYLYFRDYSGERTRFKALVASMWLVGFGHTICTWHSLYSTNVTYYCQPEHIVTQPHSMELMVLFSVMTYILVQGFFAFRVRMLSKSWLLPIICWALVAARVVLNLLQMGILWEQPSIAIYEGKHRGLMLAGSAMALASDLVITASMCFYLQKAGGSQFKETRRIVDALFIWSIETGMATSLLSILFVVFIVTRNDFIWFIFYNAQAKLYSNALMVSLNRRQILRNNNAINMSNSFQTRSGDRNRTMVVEMTTMTEVDAPVSKLAIEP